MERREETVIMLKRSLVLLLLICMLPTCAWAGGATSYTYMFSSEHQWRLTQDAYKPAGVLLADMGLNNPEDLCYYQNRLYVADANNGRVLIYDLERDVTEEFMPGQFNCPTGVFVNERGVVVADRGNACAYWLDHKKRVVREYRKPESYSYGINTVYLPQKIVADSKANVYVLSSGTYQGLVQFDEEGEFVGFFATNTSSVTLTQRLQDIFFTEEQKEKLFDIKPTGFNNLTIHPENDLVYTLTPSDPNAVIKQHSVAGTNILFPNYRITEERYEDIALGSHQEIFVSTASGIVFVYSSTGELLFSFGGQATAVDVAGYATVISGIAVDDNNCVYLLDKQRGFIHTYIPTEFAASIYNALHLFEIGNFTGSAAFWAKVLKQAPDFRAAYNALGVSSMQQGDYERAKDYYRRANNRAGYSEAQWEIRNLWLNKYFGVCLIVLFICYILILIGKMVLKKCGMLNFWAEKRVALMSRPMMQELTHVFYTIRHPIDSYYDIKQMQHCSIRSSLLIYAIALAVFIWDQAGKGYIFNRMNVTYVSPVYFLSIFVLPLALWVVCSYMVSSVMYGEGRFKSVFMGSAYMLSPYVVFMPVINLLSYVLTRNEAFVIEFGTAIIWSYVAIQLFLSVKEINNYTPRRTLGGIAISLFFIVIVVMAFSIVYMLCSEFVEMMTTIFKEVIYRA